jgi:hypothetical protein
MSSTCPSCFWLRVHFLIRCRKNYSTSQASGDLNELSQIYAAPRPYSSPCWHERAIGQVSYGPDRDHGYKRFEIVFPFTALRYAEMNASFVLQYYVQKPLFSAACIALRSNVCGALNPTENKLPDERVLKSCNRTAAAARDQDYTATNPVLRSPPGRHLSHTAPSSPLLPFPRTSA